MFGKLKIWLGKTVLQAFKNALTKHGYVIVDEKHLEAIENLLHSYRKQSRENSYFGKEKVTRL